MKTVTLEVGSRGDVTRRALEAFRGKKQAARISFATPELLWKVLTAKRWELLKTMAGQGPLTIREVARRVARDVKAVHGDVHALIDAGLLDKTYGAIRSHAPNASVVVLDYPHFYQVPGSCIFGLDNTKRTAINSGADVLDAAIQTQVGKFGGFHFADVRAAFNPHEICSSGTSWLHSVDFTNLTDSYHPFAAGYSGGYLPVMDSVTG